MAADHQETRQRLQEAIRRAEEDEGYATELQRDPGSVLREVGLDPESADALAGRAPVNERLLPFWPCNDFTCFTSRCPGTCYITFCHTTWWW